MALIRLQKFLSQAGYCSRRKGEEYILGGQVRVNGQAVSVLGTKIDPDKDVIELNGQVLKSAEKKIYIALNKPCGYVTSCDHPGEKIVLDLISIEDRVYPVGRLDKDSSGLLLLTNDGPLHNILSHPSFDHEKEYIVTTDKPLPDGALRHISEGVSMMGGKTRPATVKRISSTRFRIILKEGKNRQIRRMVRKVGGNVASLTRIRMSDIRLGNLPEGQWRFLTKDEIKTLQNITDSTHNILFS